jgi:phosphoenolpyruvate phosphomutase
MNSFVGDRHPLADIDEFSGRLRAVKDTVADDLVLVARIEALIAGYGMDEALLRAHAYADAGADAILIHSRRSTADEILWFASAWQNRLPVVIVPTKYYQTPISVYRKARIATVIWANQSMRAAMRQACHRIIAEENTASVEPNIATLDEVFELLN